MSKSKQQASTARDGDSSGARGSKKGAEAEAASLSFEGALEQLEGTVAKLEEGEMPLEEALELFEAGVTLSRQCSATLEAAERRIEILVADRGDALASVPFADEPDDEDSFGLDDSFDED